MKTERDVFIEEKGGYKCMFQYMVKQ